MLSSTLPSDRAYAAVLRRSGSKQYLAHIGTDDFVRIFSGSVRAWLKWELIAPPAFRVTTSFSTSLTALGRLTTVWYLRPDDTPGDWRNDDDVALTVAQAAEIFESLAAERRVRLQNFVEAFASLLDPVQLVLPCYAIPNGLLLLDGNHRAVAAHLGRQPVQLFLYVLHGPISSEVLPDLGHISAR